MITAANIINGYDNEEWLGFGYLGERRHADVDGLVIAAADKKAIDDANEAGLTEGQFFAWLNSKLGRWYGDCMFGNQGQHADKYLPSQLPAE